MTVKECVRRANVRPVIDSLFPKPDFTLDGDLVAPAQTENYAEMGAAFNYMFTFWLAVNHDDADIARWPTQAGLATIDREYPDYADAAHDCVDRAETALAEFIDTGVVSDALCQGALDLARVEAAYHGDDRRAIHLLGRLGEYDEGDIMDLKALYDTIPEEFSQYDEVVVNPEFGPVEVRIGGVDADVVCDHTLLDIKTTKHLRLDINYWRKLVGYATLANAAHSMGAQFTDVETTVPELERVGIYFSRHGLLWTVDTDCIYNHEQYPEFKDWFLNAFE